MKAFVAALSLLAAGASAEADPQFLVGSPLAHPLAYGTPLIYKTAEKAEKVEKMEGEAEVKEFKPVVYTNQLYPQAYHTPYYYTPKVELKKAEEIEGKPIVYSQPMTYTHQPLAYAHQPMAYAPQPLVHHTPVVYKTVEPMPKYVAKNGEVEHKVYKRDAEADAEALVYYNTYGSWPVGYVAPATYAATAPVAYASAPMATSYKYVAPTTTAYTYPYAAYAPYSAQYYGRYFL